MDRSGLCAIKMNGAEVKLRFAMPAFRWFMEKIMQGHVVSMTGNTVNETGISYLIYAGYYNECIVTDTVPVVTLAEIFKWVEENADEPGMQEQFNAVADAYKDSHSLERFEKKITDVIEANAEIKKKMKKKKR